MEKSFQERFELLMKARDEADSLIAAILFRRIHEGMSREELSEKSGVELSIIDKMEDIGFSPNIYALIMLLRAFNLSLTVTPFINDISDL